MVKTSLNVTEFECWIFFHMSTSIMHLVFTRRKPGRVDKTENSHTSMGGGGGVPCGKITGLKIKQHRGAAGRERALIIQGFQ